MNTPVLIIASIVWLVIFSTAVALIRRRWDRRYYR